MRASEAKCPLPAEEGWVMEKRKKERKKERKRRQEGRKRRKRRKGSGIGA